MKNKYSLFIEILIFNEIYRKVFFLLFLFISLFSFGQTTVTFNIVGAKTWKAPCDVTSITVKAWGAGGSGGGGTATDVKGGGGGAGGTYVSSTLAVVPGTTYDLYVAPVNAGTAGAGTKGQGSWFNTNAILFAEGGNGGAAPNNATVLGGLGSITSSIGTTRTAGGDGANGSTSVGGAGGNGSTGGGAGGAQLTITENNGNFGNPVSGGGGGAFITDASNHSGGNGARGEIQITYTSNLVNYCTKNISTAIEPITSVVFAGISNTSSNTSTVPNELFCENANVTQGSSYIVTVKGNTVGNFTDHFRLYVDWNQNGIYDTTEFYDIGTITNSTGLDAKVATVSILVPDDAIIGKTRMRVVKNYNAQSDACTAIAYGQTEDYFVTISLAPACPGTPTGGTTVIAPTTGAPSSTFNASVTGSTTGFSGLTYQWETSPTGTAGSWTPISGATTAAATITAVDFATTTYYRRKITCSGNSAYSSVKTYVTEYCTPSVGAGNEIANYIFTVAFRGTITETSNTSTFSPNPRGYQDFTGLANKAVQAQGGAVNVFVETIKESRYKAWIDWNKNGNFEDAGERVYNAGGIGQYATTFGFIIPPGTIPGDYRIRIRMSQNNATFGSCGNINDDGETEDYLFTVVTKCLTMISLTADGSGCAGEKILLKAEATGTVTEFRWYDSEVGGNLIGTSAVLAGGKTEWYTPVLNSTAVYFVEAWNATCQYLVRNPVKAFVKPLPIISFTPPSASACGDNSIIALSASGSNQTSWLINDDFELGDLGKFIEGRENSNGGAINLKTKWTNRTSAFVADGGTLWTPAVSSGAQGNKFLMTTSEVGDFYNINTTLTSIPRNTTGFTSLYLKFKMYYSRYFADNFEPLKDFVKVQYSDNGAPWQDLALILRDVGTATKFEYPVPFYDLSSFKNKTNFRIRILYHADDWCDGVAIDDVELYGDTPLETSFSWTYDNPIKFYSDELATTEYTAGNTASIIYIKPDDAQIAAYNSWNINATVQLTNGCKSVGSFTLNNDTKVWEPSSSLMTNWNDVNTWKPSVTIPDNTKCVVIRKPVSIGTGISAEAKNIKIETGGKITIDGSLKISNEIKNTLTADQFTVNSDANVLQVNDAAVNSGNITVIRTSPMTKNNYTYWSSPVEGQQLKQFSPLTSNSRFYQYDETTNLFQNVPPATNNFTPAKGYAIMAPATYTYAQGVQDFDGQFIGLPTNGTKKSDGSSLVFPLSLNSATGDFGYNLIGNPYPSNIDFEELYAINGGSSATGKIYNTAYFWTNVDPNRPGSTNGNTGYSGNAYAIYNGTGGVPGVSAGPGTGPNGATSLTPTQFIKVGQGFIVKTRPGQNGQNLIFNNSIRNSTGPSNFISKGAASGKDRYWLKLTTPLLNVNTILIGYVPNATNDFEWDYDARLFSVGSDSFYSILGENKLGIQGRTYPLNKADVVNLGVKNFEAGNYTISLGDKEGIFANGQSIYLKDKSLGIYTDLTLGAYTFSSDLGEFTNRFEIVYEPQTVLATGEDAKEQITVYREGTNFVIKSPKTIDKVEVYDASGRLLKTLQPNNRIATLEADSIASGMYFLKIKTVDEAIFSKKIIR